MRWLVGWCGATAGAARDIQPLGAHLLWNGPDPLWAVGDWRPDEIRLVQADGDTHLAVFGHCGADDATLRRSLVSARAGALRQLTLWPGSYTAVARFGRRTVVPADLAGVRPVFHTDWAGGSAYATAALPLADLTEAQLDVPHLAALLAAPEAPEATGDGTPYRGVRRVPPGHALMLREGGVRDIVDYEPAVPMVVAAPPTEREVAVAGVRDALVEAVRSRLAAPRHAPATDGGPVPGMGPADRGGRHAEPAPGVGADLSGGSASATLALLAAGLPGMPGTVFGTGATQAGERLLAVTFNDLTAPAAGTPGAAARAAELERARAIAESPRLHHVVVTGGEEALPWAGLDTGPLTDEPGPALVTASRHRLRLLAGSADHFVGSGARHVLDAHPARLADLLIDRRRRSLVRPVTALARATGGGSRSVTVPLTIYRAARRLARTPYPDGLTGAAVALRTPVAADPFTDATHDGALGASLAALAWCRPGPAARWLTGEALAEVSIRLEAVAARPRSAAGTGRPGVRRARAALARSAADHRVLEQAAEVRHQRLHAPFYDNQVVRASQALPESLRVQPGARADVLRAVLEGAGVRALPPGWGATTQAATHGEAARLGLHAHIGTLVDLFDAPLLADAGLIEARVVRKALRAAAEGERLPLDGLAELVSTEVWLRRLLARRGSCWTAEGHRDPRAVTSGVSP
ncbi:asparagine synthase-related protein [Streptomyces sp. RFCAC02]|uniref:asparagine synthase-related protein n=1 Tax=Streptomyces sp. RFCAC02 TaxID=2499143 RepID=UPI0010201F78|nr:asparagine synthase-related protein [Streptomyces sp. RFCAC02]